MKNLMIDKYFDRIVETCNKIACNCVPWQTSELGVIQMPQNPKVADWFTFSKKELFDIIFVSNGLSVSSWEEIVGCLMPHSKVYVILPVSSDRRKFLSLIHQSKLGLIDERLIDGDYHFVFRPPRYFDKPVWRGEKGITLLVHSAAGFGDDFHSGRYAYNLKSFCNQVIFESRPETFRFFSECSAYDKVIMKGMKVDYDYQITIQSLVDRFGRSPLVFPYFSIPKVKEFEINKGLNIGFAYRGNFVKILQCRIFDVKEFNAFRGASLYCLQKDLDYESKGNPLGNFLDLSSRIYDWYDTACYIGLMDYIISPDTALMHLSAAMGVQTRVFLNEDHQNFYHTYPEKTCASYPDVMKLHWGKDAVQKVAKDIFSKQIL